MDEPEEVERTVGSMDDPRDYEMQEFEHWQGEGWLWHAVGTVTLWQRGYAPEGESWSHEVRLRPELKQWLHARGCRVADSAFGPPHILFPDAATAEQFRQEWHLPGEAQRVGFYKAVREEPPFDWSNIPSLEQQEARHVAMWQAGLEARAAWLREHEL